jgi:hypothetical protein
LSHKREQRIEKQEKYPDEHWFEYYGISLNIEFGFVLQWNKTLGANNESCSQEKRNWFPKMSIINELLEERNEFSILKGFPWIWRK